MSMSIVSVLCKKLMKLQVVSPLTILDECTEMRDQYRFLMENMIKAGLAEVVILEISDVWLILRCYVIDTGQHWPS